MQRATDDDSVIENRVRTILERVRQGGDEALRAITTEIDGRCPESLQVSEAEFAEAEALVNDALKAAIRQAAEAAQHDINTDLEIALQKMKETEND